MNNVDEIFNNQAFDCLDSEMKHSLKTLYINLQGKTNEQAIPYVIAFMKSMPKNIKLTGEQKNAMIAVLTASMSDAQRRNVIMMLKMFGF